MRLAIVFPRKLGNLEAALPLHFWHYGFMRIHSTLRMTPAMSVGIMPTFGTWNLVLKESELLV
jgi:hypothetical protein